MKLSAGDKAALFLFLCFFGLSLMALKKGQGALGVCWLFAAFGCFVMLYAARKKGG